MIPITFLFHTLVAGEGPIDPDPPEYDGVDWELSVGPGWLYLAGGLTSTKYVVDWGDGSPPETHGTSSGVFRHNYTAASSTWTERSPRAQPPNPSRPKP